MKNTIPKTGDQVAIYYVLWLISCFGAVGLQCLYVKNLSGFFIRFILCITGIFFIIAFALGVYDGISMAFKIQEEMNTEENIGDMNSNLSKVKALYQSGSISKEDYDQRKAIIIATTA